MPTDIRRRSLGHSTSTTLPHLLRYDCLHHPPPLSSPLANPTTRYSPAPNRPSPQHTTSSAQCQRLQAPAHGASCRRCTQRTDEVQRRQLRHPSETRCQRRCPSISDGIACKHPPPLGSPLASPTNRYSPAPNGLGPQDAESSAHCRRSQAPANGASCPRCTQRTIKVQRRQLRHPFETRCQRRCPICSDPIACTHPPPPGSPLAGPRARYSPAHNRPSPQHAASSAHCRRSQAPGHSASCLRCQAAYR